MIEVVSYGPGRQEEWDTLNRSARNGHFFFYRAYMEYHSARFRDASLMFYRDSRLIALLPATRRGEEVFSHGGLTFGGLILNNHCRSADVLAVFSALCRRLGEDGVSRLIYKPVPHIYHLRPAQEDLYAIWRQGGQLVRRDVSTAIDLAMRGLPSERRARGDKRARKEGLRFEQSQKWGVYWAILEQTLHDRHEVRPTHSLEEITGLARSFPHEIKLYGAFKETEMVAGVVVFDTARVAHAQYIAASPTGRECAALDGLFASLIEAFMPQKRYFSFGISTEDEGRVLNTGLVRFKEEFGGSCVIQDVYELIIAEAT